MPALSPGPFEVESSPVTICGPDGGPVEAFHARPESMPIAGVVLHPDIFGLRPLFETMAETLATNGLAVVVVEPFTRIDPDVRAGLDAPARLDRVADFEDEYQLGDLAAAADRLVVDDDVNRVSVLGFCFGGTQALKAAATDRFDAAVACYGMLRLRAGWASERQVEPLAGAAHTCPTLAIFGGVDSLTPAADIEALRAEWADRPDCEIVVYPEADHGFVHDPERPAHRAADAADAWRRALAWMLPS